MGITIELWRYGVQTPPHFPQKTFQVNTDSFVIVFDGVPYKVF